MSTPRRDSFDDLPILAELRELLERAVEPGRSGRRRRPPRLPTVRLGHLAPAAGVLLVVGVVAVFLGIHSRRPSGQSPGSGTQLAFRALPTPQVPVVNHAAVARAVEVLQQRINSVFPGVHVSGAGDKVFVRAATSTHISRAQLLALTGAGRLALYDWEANVLAPNGKTVASQLQTHDPSALELSQGSGSVASGDPGAGSLSLYEAVKLASRQPKNVSVDNSRLGPEYFMFGAPGDPACTSAASYYGTRPVVRSHCYLSGPAAKLQELNSTLPPGVSASQGEVLAIQQGTVVLQAVPANFASAPSLGDPTAQFYVLRDHVALFGNDITKPRQSTSQSGSPSVSFGFTSRGRSEFQNVTARIAHRGDLVSGLGQMLNQHFAITLDTQLITVPYIDFKTFPDGVAGNAGADIAAGLTSASASRLAQELRLGALPIRLKLMSRGS